MAGLFTKTDLVDYCANELGQPKGHIVKILDTVIDGMHKALLDGRRIRLGDIGTIERVRTAARKGRNPRTGVAIDINAAHRLKVRASREMRG